MKKFLQWVQDKNLDVSLPQEENTKRAGMAHWAYPDAYARKQYPDSYFMPKAADAVQKMGKKKA